MGVRQLEPQDTQVFLSEALAAQSESYGCVSVDEAPRGSQRVRSRSGPWNGGLPITEVLPPWRRGLGLGLGWRMA